MTELQTITLPDIRDELAREGLVVLRDVLTAEEKAKVIEAGREAAELLEISQRSGRLYNGEMPDVMRSLYAMPTLVRLVQQVLGEDVSLYLHRPLIKDEHWSGAVANHQDVAYLHGGIEKLHVFMGLNHIGPENGGLAYWKRSHRFGILGQGKIKEERFSDVELTPVIELDPGDVLVMHHCTWHESGESEGTTPRYLYQATYQPSSDSSNATVEPILVSGKWLTNDHINGADANMYSHVQYWMDHSKALEERVAELEAQLRDRPGLRLPGILISRR